MNEARAVLLFAGNCSKWVGEWTGNYTVLNSPRDPESHCCHQLSHPAVVNGFNAVLGAEVQDSISIPGTSCVRAVGPLTATQGAFPSCAYTQMRWVRLSPTTKLCWSPWGYIWAGFALCIEASLGSCVVMARTGRNFVEVSYCPSGALAGCDDIPLKTLPRVLCGSMLLHPHPDWALFQQLVNDCPFLQSQIQPSVLKLWWDNPSVVQAVRGAVEGFGASSTCSVAPGTADVPWSWAEQEQVHLCLQEDVLLLYPAPTRGLCGTSP